MKKFRKLTVGLLLLLSCVLMSACGKKFTCCECGDTVKTAYYDIAHDDEYVLCESCASDYWWPLDYTKYKVPGSKAGSKQTGSKQDSPKKELPVSTETPEPTKDPDAVTIVSDGIAMKSGHYAIVDSSGNPLTGFIYDSAEGFINGRCIVRKGKAYGMVDRSGKEILPLNYEKLYYIEYMICFKSLSCSATDGSGLMDADLNVLIPDGSDTPYGDYVITDKYIFAEKSFDEIHLLDMRGNNLMDTLPGDGAAVVSGGEHFARAVSAEPPVNGVITVKYYISGVTYNDDYRHFRFMDENLNLITDKKWRFCSDFNVRGYAAAQECEYEYVSRRLSRNGRGNWYAVGKDGSLTYLADGYSNEFIYADPYFAVRHAGLFSKEQYYLLDVRTGTETALSEFREYDGCLLVRDFNTKLYGLVDGDEMALDFRYSDIYYQDGVFCWTEGAEHGTYTPKGFIPLKPSGGSAAPVPVNTPAPVSTPAPTIAPSAAPAFPPVYTPVPTIKEPAPAASNEHIISVFASSYLVEDVCTHSVDRILDGQMRTAWVEGAEGQGYGEYVSIGFDGTYAVSRISIANGYQLDERRYTVNSRPKVLSVYFSNGEYMFLNLEDIMGLQTFIFPEPVETEAVVIMIEEVYPGTLCEDTCITDVSFG